MPRTKRFVALDVGEKRIGVAQGDSGVRIAVPYDTIERDGTEISRIAELILRNDASCLVVGYPRNQAGEPTQQTEAVETFVSQLRDLDVDIVFQDESLTSVLAEQRLMAEKKPYTKGDIDALAASIILQDYMESHL